MQKQENQSTSQYDLNPYRLEDFSRDIEKMHGGLQTGLGRLDDQIRIPPGAITVITARTSEGKTSFLLNLLLNMLQKGDKKFYFFSYDEPARDIAVKIIMIMAGEILSSDSKSNFDYYLAYLKQRREKKRGRRKNSQIEQAIDTFNQYISNKRLPIFDDHYHSEMLASHIENLSSDRMTAAVFVDYIQKISFSEGSKNLSRYIEIQRISALLLETIKHHNVPLIMAAQAKIETMYSKSNNGTTNLAIKMPIRLDSIREATDIVHDANLVLGLSLGPANNGGKKGNNKVKTTKDELIMEVSILKNRNGRAGIKLNFPFNGPVFKLMNTHY